MRFLLILIGCFSLAASLFAENPNQWSQFRGPNGQGVAPAQPAPLPVEWSDDSNIAWKVPLPGPGSSGPIVTGDRVFVVSYRRTSSEVLRFLTAFRVGDGETLWEKTIPEWHPEDPFIGYIEEHGYGSNTPVTDGEFVYAYFGKAGVYCFTLDGEEVWKAETGSGSSSRQWGSASSPILYEDKLIVPAGDETGAVLALSRQTGEVIWRAEDATRMHHTYGTPVIVRVDEARTDLVFAVKGGFWGLDPDTGTERWWAAYNLPSNMSNTVHISGDILTTSGGFPRTARVAIRAGGSGDRTDELLYDTMKPTSYMTSPVEVDGVLYWVADRGIAFAAKPGKAEGLWQERLPNITKGSGKPFYASPIYADGRIYAVSRENGTFVMEPNPEGLRVIAQNEIASDETQFDGNPAIAAGAIFLRSDWGLYCLREER